MSKKKGKATEKKNDEEKSDNRLFYLILMIVVGPAIVVSSVGTRYYYGVLLGIALEAWGIWETPEIHSYLKLIINWRGRKQAVKVQNSPGAQTVTAQGKTITQIINPTTQTDHELADMVYTPLRNEISDWKDPRYANFSVLQLLDKQIPRLVKKIRQDITGLLTDAKYLFDDINVLRGSVSTLIREESNRLAQDFAPKFFDRGSKIVFNNIRILVDGQDIPFYLPHVWVMGQTPTEYVRTLVRENHPHLTQRGLELIATGERAGSQISQVVAKDEEAIRFAENVMKYLQTKEPATRYQNNLRRIKVLGSKLIPLIDEELTKL